MSTGINGYRRLLKAAKVAFKSDALAIMESKKELRIHFEQNKKVNDPNVLKELISSIDEVEEMLRFAIVQGALNQKGNYG